MRSYSKRAKTKEENEMRGVYCSNNCGRRTDNFPGICRSCMKEMHQPLDFLEQLEL